MKKLFCQNCISYNVCKYAEKRDPDMCRDYLFRSNPIREIMKEYERQDEKWGVQNHPLLLAPLAYVAYKVHAKEQKSENNFYIKQGTLSWDNILLEEVYEAFAETDPARQREEMIQVAAVAVQIIECLDRRMEAEKEYLMDIKPEEAQDEKAGDI